MNKEKLESILEDMLSTGGDFAEIFIEDKKTTVFSFVNQILDSYQVGFSNGLGLRLAKDNNVYYTATNDFSTKNIKDVLLQGFDAKDTAFINWETITKKDNNALKEAERKNLYERVHEAHNNGYKFIELTHSNECGLFFNIA